MKEVVGDTHVLDMRRGEESRKEGEGNSGGSSSICGRQDIVVLENEEGREERVSDDRNERVEIIHRRRRSVTPINRDHNELGGREGG